MAMDSGSIRYGASFSSTRTAGDQPSQQKTTQKSGSNQNSTKTPPQGGNRFSLSNLKSMLPSLPLGSRQGSQKTAAAYPPAYEQTPPAKSDVQIRHNWKMDNAPTYDPTYAQRQSGQAGTQAPNNVMVGNQYAYAPPAYEQTPFAKSDVQTRHSEKVKNVFTYDPADALRKSGQADSQAPNNVSVGDQYAYAPPPYEKTLSAKSNFQFQNNEKIDNIATHDFTHLQRQTGY